MTDLASAIAAAVAAVTIQHEDWCCAKGCTQPHYELTPPVDDGSDSPFMAPGIRKLGHCAGTEDDCSCWRRIALQHVREGVEAAAPLIEAAVRERAAEEIRAAIRPLSDEKADTALKAVGMAVSSAIRQGMQTAARIVERAQ